MLEDSDLKQAGPDSTGLTQRQAEMLTEVTREVQVDSGTVLFENGDLTAHEMFILLDGSVEIKGPGKNQIALHAPDSFGGLALLTNQPRNETAVATTPCTLYVIPQQTMHDVLLRCGAETLGQRISRLRKSGHRVRFKFEAEDPEDRANGVAAADTARGAVSARPDAPQEHTQTLSRGGGQAAAEAGAVRTRAERTYEL